MIPDVGKEIAKDVTIKALQELLRQVGPMLRRQRSWRRRRFVRSHGADLDDLVRDLSPCFTLGEPTSLQQVFYQLTPNRNEQWPWLHDEFNILGAWFRGWGATRQAVGEDRTAEVLVCQLEELNSLLFYSGSVGMELAKLAGGLAPDHAGKITFKTVADRYNDFLTRYERLLRRLPEEVGVLDYPPVLGRERFFIRIGS